MSPADNAALRTAVEAFAASPDKDTYLEVVRQSLQGDLLLDITGSDSPTTHDDGSVVYEAGAHIAILGGDGPDGGRALFAYTRQDEARKQHPDDPEAVQTLVQSAPATLQFAETEGYDWLVIDPVGPTCALKISDLDFVLANPRNDVVRAALGGTDEAEVKAATLAALAEGGQLLYAVAEQEDGAVEVRTSVGPNGPVMLAFTSAAEAVARDTTDAFAAIDIPQVVDDALKEPFEGLVINPVGPWVHLGTAELIVLKQQFAADAS